ncbi:deoxynucleoside triphosphate triphosphohydrolase SAMHD1-like [Electrophorus electricus]|uniref:deoxynucleoside triphosphate triphosphohydrolase SAMHD1-like n=1 Tax=Electrophorus electricus TaxID=8005 RepID=UPI0015CFC729|nr:deoxynucleoside triphosphate triphosphohydrolase SAMHD1-like [Electrophorus electricus]
MQIFKVFNDPIHGHIQLHPLLVKIIDTPHFQRLRNIKQLGGGYYVFPGASHNRFEHSIGVAHLAGKLVKCLHGSQKIKKTNEEKKEKEELCVQIAGLCHDLGHGPFSHLFEEFMKKKDPNWKHEEQGITMFEDLIKDREVAKEMKEYKIEQQDIKFIQDLICGMTASEHQSFLYEIVNNAKTGIDVDKMDYFSRDCHHLGMTSNFSHERYMVFARVCTNDDGAEHICMRDKEALNMYELFHVRNLLHHTAYQHRVVKAVELMILDALTAADKTFKFSDKVKDPKAYLNLTVKEILNSTNKDSGIVQAQNIIKRIFERKLYRFIRGKTFQTQEVRHLDMVEQQQNKVSTWWNKINGQPSSLQLSADDFTVKLAKFNYGMKDKNPVDSLRFYTKDDPHKPITLSKDEVSYLLHEKFSETKVLLFYRGENKDVEKLAKQNIEAFWEEVKKTDQ